MSDIANIITLDERSRLYQLEETIRQGLNTFVDVGNALLEIRDKRLYRQEYSTFEEYCREQWNIERRRAYQLMDAAQVVENVYLSTQTAPMNELQARPLTSLEPDKQVEAWKRVITSTPEGKVTASIVLKAAKEVAREKREERRQEREEIYLQNIDSNLLQADNRITLYQGDMTDVLSGLGPFDLIVTDPPYGVTNYEWDILKTKEWLEALLPHLANEYNLFWFCSPKHSADIELIFRELGLQIQSRIVWHRRNMAMGSKSKFRFIDTWELAIHAGNRELNFPDNWSEAWFDVQEFAVPQTNFNDRKIHPTQKPEGLIKRLVEFGSYSGDKILDPFAGSGTTGAVTPFDRTCVLIEREEEYAKLIEARLGVNRTNGI